MIVLSLEYNEELGEFMVGYYKDDILDKNKSYYTDDKKDAKVTMECMKQEVLENGYQVNTQG